MKSIKHENNEAIYIKEGRYDLDYNMQLLTDKVEEVGLLRTMTQQELDEARTAVLKEAGIL